MNQINKKHIIILVVCVIVLAFMMTIQRSGPAVEVTEEQEVNPAPTGSAKPKSTSTSKPKPTSPPAPGPGVAENPEGEADPDRMNLNMTTWRWISALYNDGTEVKPKVEGQFRLTLEPTGTFHLSTDCNSMGGKYQVNGNLIDFTEVNTTLMFCPGSQEQDFVKILQNATSYFFTSRGELILELKYDSGTATFR